jgi:hypothetical protein
MLEKACLSATGVTSPDCEAGPECQIVGGTSYSLRRTKCLIEYVSYVMLARIGTVLLNKLMQTIGRPKTSDGRGDEVMVSIQYSHEMRIYVNDRPDSRGNRSTIDDKRGFRCSSQTFCRVPWPIMCSTIAKKGLFNPYSPDSHRSGSISRSNSRPRGRRCNLADLGYQ